MAAAVLLRDDFDGPALRRLAKDAAQARRLLALAEINDGGSRTDAARIGDVGPRTVRDWVPRFNARGPAGLIDGKAPGNASKLDDARRRALADIVSAARSPRSTRWCGGGLPVSRIGSGRSSASRSARPRRAANCGRSATGRCPRVRATSRRTNWPSTLLGKTACRDGRDPREAPGRNRNRAVVAGVSVVTPLVRVTMANARVGRKNNITRPLSARRASPRGQRLGETLHATPRPSRPADEMGMHLRSHPSESRAALRAECLEGADSVEKLDLIDSYVTDSIFSSREVIDDDEAKSGSADGVVL